MTAKRRNKTRRVWLGRAILLAFSLAILTSGLYGYQTYGKRWLAVQFKALVKQISPTIKQIEVQTDMNLHSLQLKQRLKSHFLDFQGAPLLQFSKQESMAKLLELPFIEKVDLQRFFDGTMRLKLKMRRPFAMVNRPPYFVDQHGYLFSLPDEDIGADFIKAEMPVITGIPDHWFRQKSGRFALNQNQQMILKQAVELLGMVTPLLIEYQDRVVHLKIQANNGYSLATEQFGGNILFGMPPFATKQQRLAKMLARFRNDQQPLADIALLDLDYRQQAFVRFKGSSNHQENSDRIKKRSGAKTYMEGGKTDG